MALGKRSHWVANGVYQRGANKGKPKWELKFEDGGVRDVLEISKQLSYYRYLMKQHGLEVKDINIFSENDIYNLIKLLFWYQLCGTNLLSKVYSF